MWLRPWIPCSKGTSTRRRHARATHAPGASSASSRATETPRPNRPSWPERLVLPGQGYIPDV
eukprot:1575869-Pleurochrysis_carterae.AAC.1